MLNSIAPSSVSPASAQPSGALSSEPGLGQAQFLLLMLTQLKNQDPLKPMDSQQFLGQLAQFSTVQGIQGIQASLEAQAENGLSSASSWLGRSAWAPLEQWSALEGESLVARSGASSGPVTWQVWDGETVVHTQTLDARENFDWDGATPNQTYRVTASDASGADLPVLARVTVQEIALENGAVWLQGGGQWLPLSQVQRLGVSP